MIQHLKVYDTLVSISYTIKHDQIKPGVSLVFLLWLNLLHYNKENQEISVFEQRI